MKNFIQYHFLLELCDGMAEKLIDNDDFYALMNPKRNREEKVRELSVLLEDVITDVEMELKEAKGEKAAFIEDITEKYLDEDAEDISPE